MNYYGPRKRESDGRWDYTCLNDGHIWPVGYCSAFREIDPKIIPISEAQQEALLISITRTDMRPKRKLVSVIGNICWITS